MTKLPQLIGITGPAGAGKDTAANALLAEYGYTVYSLAGPIKAALNVMFGWHPAKWKNRAWKEAPLSGIGASPRRLAQTLGTEWGRAIHPDLWLELAREAIMGAEAPGVVIPDVRFGNEAEWIHERGGVVIRVVRPDATAVEAHSSEAGLSGALIDAYIVNDGSIADLRRRTLDCARLLSAPQAPAAADREAAFIDRIIHGSGPQ